MVNEKRKDNLKKKEAAAGAFKLFYMAIIVAALSGAYYFLSPFFDTIKKAPALIDKATQSLDELKKNIPDPSTVESTINTLKDQGANSATLKKAEKVLQTAQVIASSTSH